MKSTIAAYGFCFAAGAFLARYDLHTDDTGVEAGLILTIAFILGCWHPRHAWQWALLVGPWAPAAELIWGKGSGLAAVLAFTIALGLAGAYLGVALRKLVSAATNPTA